MNGRFQNATLRDVAWYARLNINAALRRQRVPQAIIILGAPGSGKSQWTYKKHIPNSLPNIFAECLGVDVSEIGIVIEKPARRDAAEMAGVALPMEGENGEVYTQFTVSPIIKKIEATGKRYGLLIFDEGAAAAIPEAKLLSDCLDANEHAIGGNWLPGADHPDAPPGLWIVVLTGNRTEDKAQSMKLLSQNISRALCFNLIFDPVGWKEDFCDVEGINPIVVECAMANVENGFFADAVPAEQVSYNTPRSTVAASYHLDEFMASPEFTGTIPPRMENMLAANMGPAAAKMLADWIAQRDHIPTAEDIMANPETAKVPDQTGFQQLAAHIAMGAVKDVHTATAALHYIVRLRKDLQISLGVKLLNITSRNGWLMTDPLASAFIAEHHEFLPVAQANINL